MGRSNDNAMIIKESEEKEEEEVAALASPTEKGNAADTSGELASGFPSKDELIDSAEPLPSSSHDHKMMITLLQSYHLRVGAHAVQTSRRRINHVNESTALAQEHEEEEEEEEDLEQGVSPSLVSPVVAENNLIQAELVEECKEDEEAPNRNILVEAEEVKREEPNTPNCTWRGVQV